MEYPPSSWQVFEADLFATAQPRSPGELGAELCVQARPNGRMLDHFRITLGRNRILDVNFAMAKVLQIPQVATWRFKMQQWPRDVVVRRNMTTTEWVNMEALISAKNASVYDGDEILDHAEVVADLRRAEAQVALRFGVVVGSDHHLQLMLQALPLSTEALLSKPTFRM
jgi:hypothetical protein